MPSRRYFLHAVVSCGGLKMAMNSHRHQVRPSLDFSGSRKPDTSTRERDAIALCILCRSCILDHGTLQESAN